MSTQFPHFEFKRFITGSLLALLLTACGQGEVTVPAATDQPTQAELATATGTAPEQLPTATQAPESEISTPTVAVGATTLGDILVNSQGLTLYAFANDSPAGSACTGSCAELWPPLTTEGAPGAGEGVNASLLGTINRPDGSSQLTYAGRPLYTFSEDGGPGDTNGQGFGGVWFVLGPDGELIQESDEGPVEMEDPYYPY